MTNEEYAKLVDKVMEELKAAREPEVTIMTVKGPKRTITVEAEFDKWGGGWKFWTMEKGEGSGWKFLEWAIEDAFEKAFPLSYDRKG